MEAQAIRPWPLQLVRAGRHTPGDMDPDEMRQREETLLKNAMRFANDNRENIIRLAAAGSELGQTYRKMLERPFLRAQVAGFRIPQAAAAPDETEP